jgi:Flp pilus assembly protein TadG
MNTKASDRKKSPILITIVVVGLISLAGLAIDGSKTYLARHTAQNAAESAAQAAAQALAQGQDVTSTAQATAAQYGYDDDGSGDRVMINNPPAKGCQGKNSSQAGNPEYVQVVIQTNLNTYFAQVVGIQETYICVEAIGHATPSANSMLGQPSSSIALR